MKKIMKAAAVTIAACISLLPISGCSKNKDENNVEEPVVEEPEVVFTPVNFGEFSYYGKWLTSKAMTSIDSSEAKNIIGSNADYSSAESDTFAAETYSVISSADMGERPAPDTSLVSSLAKTYESCDIEVIYYTEAEGYTAEAVSMVTTTYHIQGADLRNMLIANEYMPFSQLNLTNIVIFDEMIDYMQNANEIFDKSENSETVPFKKPYTYHKGSDGNVVIQMRDYAELASSDAGGVSSSFRQDVEFAYNAYNVLTHWQTSLGIYLTTPDGTVKQGYIYEVNLTWTAKE